MVCVFTRKTSEPLASLVKQIDEKIAENPELKSFVVYLTDVDGETEVQKTLEQLAEEQSIKNVPLTLMDTPGGPPSYHLDKDAEVTVMLWRQHAVRANHSFDPGEFDDAAVDRVLEDLSKILPR